MARFRYKMQSILDIKEKLEGKAKQDFAAANRRLQEEQDKLEQLRNRKEMYLEEGVRLRSETLDIQKMKENKMAVLKMDEYIQQQLMEIKKASKAVEIARAALQEVMQERKVHEKLRENAFQDFLKEEQTNENKEIDQLTSYTHGQKLMEENASKNG